MPRPKGSKNKNVTTADKIAAIELELEALKEQVKEKKAELKKLAKVKAAEEKAAAAAAAEERKKMVIKALADSGKSYDEILEMLQGAEK